MTLQHTKTLTVDQKKKPINETSNPKQIILWIIHNLKFLFIPGSNLEELTYRQFRYELSFPKKHPLKQFKSPLFIIGSLLIFLLLTITIFPDWISPYTYYAATVNEELYAFQHIYYPPSPLHPLGQTFRGLDVLARILFGARPVVIFTLTATLISCLVGIFIGAISAYYGRWLDAVLMRIMDIILSFPGVVFAVFVMLIWGSDYLILIITYSIIGVPYFARIIRSNIVKEKELPYIVAARVSGAKSFRIIFRHILPNCLLPLIVAASFNIARNILSLAILGFLRISNIGWIEWGYDIALSLNRLYSATWAVFYPALMILLSSVGFLLFGDSLADIGLLRKEIL